MISIGRKTLLIRTLYCIYCLKSYRRSWIPLISLLNAKLKWLV